MSWRLLKPQEKSEDVKSDESTDEEDNRLRQEYVTNRVRIRLRQQFEFIKLLNRFALYNLIVHLWYSWRKNFLRAKHNE